jgi:hypothetical protein
MITTSENPQARPATSPAERLRSSMAAVRVSTKQFGTRKTLTREQTARAADAFGAEEQFVSAGKRLLDTRHPAFKAVSAIRGRAAAYWRGVTLPYPETGIRLIRQDQIAGFDEQFADFSSALREAVQHLDEHYAELKASARAQLGRLFNPADYPESLRDMFALNWDFPSVEPPDYLRELSPELYRQEQARVAARFDDAVRLAEEAFTSELSSLIGHLTERLTGESDGKPKVFRDSAIGNLREFFDRFRELNIRSNQQLDGLVEQARQIVRGVDPQSLRGQPPLRERIAADLATVQSALDELLVDRPRRNLLRHAK